MASLHYLTVQDMIWINLRVTGQEPKWHFMRLEEGTFYQYAYGESSDLFKQAARFAAGFVKNSPFEAGNRETAAVAALTFLAMNGMDVKVDGAIGAWFDRASNPATAEAAINEVAEPSAHHHEGEPGVHHIAEEFFKLVGPVLAQS